MAAAKIERAKPSGGIVGESPESKPLTDTEWSQFFGQQAKDIGARQSGGNVPKPTAMPAIDASRLSPGLLDERAAQAQAAPVQEVQPQEPQEPPSPLDHINPGAYDSPYVSEEGKLQSKVGLAHNLLGLEWAPGSAAVTGGEVPVSRTDAVDMEMSPEFANLAERERRIVLDNADVEREDAEIELEALNQRQALIDEQMAEKAERVAIEREYVRRDRADLDEQFAKHRSLISKGVDPWRSFDGGSLSGKVSAALGVMTMTMSGPDGAERGMALLNNIIDHEVSRQKYAIETQGEAHDNAYNRLRTSLGDRDQAEVALESLMLEGAKVKLQILASSTADAHIQANANSQILEIDKRLLATAEEFERLARGKVNYQIIQPRAGSRGHWRYKEGLAAKTSGDFAENAKTGAETGKIVSEIAPPNQSEDKIFASIPEKIRNEYILRQSALGNLEKFFNKIGVSVDPETKELVGDMPENVPGLGFGGWTPDFAMSAKQADISTARNLAILRVQKEMNGVSRTPAEIKSMESVTGNAFSGEAFELQGMKTLYEAIREEADSYGRNGMTPEQLNAAKSIAKKNAGYSIVPGLTDEKK